MSQVEVVGASQPLEDGSCRVIAEAGVNHNNSVERAIELVHAAADAGAWGIKFQLYKAERISIPASPKYWADELGTQTQYEAFKKSDKLSYEAFREVAAACANREIVFLATPFDFEAVKALRDLETPIYKIASGDITHRPLLEAVADTGKPVILSTGASTEEEVAMALEWLDLPPERLILLVCTLSYPTNAADAHFARVSTFQRSFSPYLVGVSDHTLGTAGGWLAGALGAACLEKHFTLDKSLPDVPDHKLSVDPTELQELVRAAELATLMRGDPRIGVREAERPARLNARRSIVVVRQKEPGDRLSREDLDFKRPGTGLAPFVVDDVVGRVVKTPIDVETVLQEDMLKPADGS